MRIALLHYTCPPIAGGVERVLADHARLFARRGHAVTIVAGEGAPVDEPGVRVEILPDIRHAEAGGFDAAAAERLGVLLFQHEVVFLHNVLTMPFHLPLAEALWRIAGDIRDAKDGRDQRRPRFIAWIHDVAAANPDYAPAPVLFAQANPAVEYIAVSELRRREWCAVSGLSAERCRVIPNGIHALDRLRLTPDVRGLAETWRILERDAVLLHPTRLLRRKNIEASLHVIAALGVPAPLLLITGAADPHRAASAAYARELRALAGELQIEDRVCFVSDHFSPSDGDVDSLYALADALLYPSLQEGFGLPVLEAALHRLPIFARDLETLRGLLPEGGASFFDGDVPPAQIAAEMRRQLADSRTIRNRKAVVRRYGWPAIDQNFLAPLLAGTETDFSP